MKTPAKTFMGAVGIATLLACGALTPAAAQEAATETPAESDAAAPAGAEPEEAAADPLIARVNGTDIRESDVRSMISKLPQQIQQLPPQTVVAIAVEQLVNQELLLQEAQAQDTGQDPEVQALVAEMVEDLTEQAVLQVWMTRHLEGELTEELLQEEFARYQQENPGAGESFGTLRPQLEQALRQRLLNELAASLRADAEIVFFDASGNPVEPQATDAAPAEDGTSDGEPGAQQPTDADAGAEDDTSSGD